MAETLFLPSFFLEIVSKTKFVSPSGHFFQLFKQELHIVCRFGS